MDSPFPMLPVQYHREIGDDLMILGFCLVTGSPFRYQLHSQSPHSDLRSQSSDQGFIIVDLPHTCMHTYTIDIDILAYYSCYYTFHANTPEFTISNATW